MSGGNRYFYLHKSIFKLEENELGTICRPEMVGARSCSWRVDEGSPICFLALPTSQLSCNMIETHAYKQNLKPILTRCLTPLFPRRLVIKVLVDLMVLISSVWRYGAMSI